MKINTFNKLFDVRPGKIWKSNLAIHGREGC